MSEAISRDEWLKAMGEAAAPPDPDAVTVPEIAALLGMTRHTAYRHVLRLVDEGKAVPTFKRATGRSGVTKRVQAYKLVKATKGKR
jgi:predicted ArsR family transcriptional regulator